MPSLKFDRRLLVPLMPLVFASSAAACSPSSFWEERGDFSADLPEPGPPNVRPNRPADPPNFGTPVAASRRTVPISGGTLAIRGRIAVASDPDRDLVSIVDLTTDTKRNVALTPGDEPGRVVLDDQSLAHVVLREGGAIVTIDTRTAEIVARRAVCRVPRGIAFDATTRKLSVACAEGSLVRVLASVPDGTVDEPEVIPIPVDARDVVIKRGITLVSTFRSPSIYGVNIEGKDRYVMDHDVGATAGWRLMPVPDEANERWFALLRQSVSTQPVSASAGGYGTSQIDCGGIVNTVITSSLGQLTIPEAVVAVDGTAFAGGYAIVAAGNTYNASAPNLVLATASDPTCGHTGVRIPGETTAVVQQSDTELLVQTREPAALFRVTFDRSPVNPDLIDLHRTPVVSEVVRLSEESVRDTGHMIFHANAGMGIACASCHPEGADDGHVWNFAQGSTPAPRRTPSLRGTVAGSAPYHWEGDMRDMSVLLKDVFVGRMSGPALTPVQEAHLQTWVEGIAPPKPFVAQDTAAAVRGKAVYDTKSCASCHGTGTTSFDVGTRGVFQAPRLIGVGARAPYLHDGCASTLEARFTDASCGGGEPHVGTLTTTERADIIQYLKSL